MTRDAASQRQVEAADPSASTWLSANAGSGKTSVLTDRVARLLLSGVDPQRILCLTYTKAAAAEMQNRLFRRLGAWAMLEGPALREALAVLGLDGEIGEDRLVQARRLFARALEVPGGLRIQTIHSFCAGLLRRFPLEAGVSPRFTEMDERAAKLLIDEIVEDLADGPAASVIAGVARFYAGESLGKLAAEVAALRAALVPPLDEAAVLALFGLPQDAAAEALVAEAVTPDTLPLLTAVAAIAAGGSAQDQKLAERLAALEGAPADLAMLAALEDTLLYGAKTKAPFAAKIGALPTKATRARLGQWLAEFEAVMTRVEAVRPRRLALMASERTAALHAFAARFLPEFAARKAARGWLDFDDLIARAKALLTDPAVAQWVLFRLDGGIDHILVDEAQDTSPDQWAVIAALTQEFTAGRGARDTYRSIFVVGDRKQSIYSFQGADLQAFDRVNRDFTARLDQVGTALQQRALEHSFRSSPAILRLVDATFAGEGLGGPVRHLAFHADMPGRVDLWPAVPAPDSPEPGAWDDPVDLPTDTAAEVVLAQRIAAAIAGMIARGERITVKGKARPMTAGDVLILVQRRSSLFGQIIRACKAAGLPIAGADRLKLGAELAVKDLLALLSFLATPEDDLSLAALLRSPLLGWSEDQLFRLAHGRAGSLWQALRAGGAEHPETLAMLHDLRDQADFLRPHDLIERMLTRHAGRRRLIARLGEEAEDGIDALLSQALAYEQTEVPGLTGFLTWATTEEIEVKRQMESAGDRIRVMTVHGSKGLEAPVVILPETQDRRPREAPGILPIPGGAVWTPPAAEMPDLVAGALAARRERNREERLRLLYVAMTRAQSWLIVAAAGRTEQEDCWYNLISAGMRASGAEALPDGTLRLSHGTWPTPDASATPAATAEAPLPDWARRPPAAVAPAPGTLSPTGLGGAKILGEVPADHDADLEAAALRRGSYLHLLMEHLPFHPPEARRHAGLALLARAEAPATGEEAAGLIRQAEAILADPALAPAFAEGLGEVAVSGELGGQRVYGIIDRLIVAPGRVTVIDFKTNRAVPARPEEVPESILRQMGAYLALVQPLYPAARVEVQILWTEGPKLMGLPHDLVMAALQRAGFP